MHLEVFVAFNFAFFAAATSGEPGVARFNCKPEPEENTDLDGYNLFGKNLTRAWLITSNYELSTTLNDSRCLHTGIYAFPVGHHGLRRVFLYTNFSDEAAIGIAHVNMTFFTTTTGSQYNGMNSTFEEETAGYHLPPPQWKFKYLEDTCAVVERILTVKDHQDSVPTERQDAPTAARCELWHLEDLTEKLTPSKTPLQPSSSETDDFEKDIFCCRQYFNVHCKEGTTQEIYNSTLCA